MQASARSLTRQDLERMKRIDIQKICKDYGVKANMKTEALIELLLDTMRSNISPLVQPPRPQPQPQAAPAHTPMATRRVSTRSRTSSRTSSGTRTRGTSGSSVVIHDTEDESVAGQSSTTQASESVASSSRIRKAKDTQFRLGVGRPVIAGGQGARAVTRTASIAKGKRTRVSTISRPPVEETIEEEPELPIPDNLPTIPQTATAPASTSGQQVISRIDKLEALLNEANLRQQFDTLKDVITQVTFLKTSLERREMEIMNIRGELQACRLEVMVLRGETAKIPSLESQLRAAKENSDRARESSSGSPSKQQTIRRVSFPFAESNTNSLPPAPSAQQSPAKAQMPGPTETTLGKRHRDSGSSILTGISDGDGGSTSEKDLTKRIVRPNRKRTKTNEVPNAGPSKKAGASSAESDGHSAEQDSADGSMTGSSAPSTVPPIGTPPPSNHLPDYFEASIETAQQHTPKHLDQYTTDGGLLGFSFSHVASSTPRGDMYGYLGEPFSPGSALRAGIRPTAGTSSTAHHAGGGLQPTAFGAHLVSPSPSPRPRTPARSQASTGTGLGDMSSTNSPSMVPQYTGSPLAGLGDTTEFVFQFTDPDPEQDQQQLAATAAAGAGAGTRREGAAQLPIGLGYGYGGLMMMGGGGLPDESPERPTPRTMYGTEIQHDTRFGEFGRDGLAGVSSWLNAGLFNT